MEKIKVFNSFIEYEKNKEETMNKRSFGFQNEKNIFKCSDLPFYALIFCESI